jgi:hypothetical protein
MNPTWQACQADSDALLLEAIAALRAAPPGWV